MCEHRDAVDQVGLKLIQGRLHVHQRDPLPRAGSPAPDLEAE